MNKKIRTIGMALVAGVTAIILNGCTGKDGAPGPQGPQGNANVYAMSYSILPSQWGYSAPVLWVDLIDPDINSDIINTGVVLVYATSNGNSNQLPYTYYPTSSYSETMSATHYVGNVEIDITDSDLAAPATPGPMTFKVIVMTSRQMLQRPHVNFKDYESVRQAFNLK